MLGGTLDQPVSLDEGLALPIGELTDRREVRLQVNVAIVEGLLNDPHAVFEG